MFSDRYIPKPKGRGGADNFYVIPAVHGMILSVNNRCVDVQSSVSSSDGMDHMQPQA